MTLPVIRTTSMCKLITQERLKELFDYDFITGEFTSKTNRSVGWEERACSNLRYIRICIDYKQYFLHRLAWLYVYGDWPNEIDHIDGNGLNNSIYNLRNVDRQGNQKNRRISKNNMSGMQGVYKSSKSDVWAAQISINNKNRFLGQYTEFWDAVCARKSAENKYGFHPNHGRI